MGYNLTNFTNSTDLYEMANAVSDASGGQLGTFVLIGVAIICFLSMLQYNLKVAMLVTSIFTASIAIFLRLLGWVGDLHVYVTILLCAASFLYALVYRDDQ